MTQAVTGGVGAPQPVRFTGSGGEYFRIWIVNLALSILTLGIYSAWAKVRRMQYFYRNTELAGASFDYHGEPVAILKGRLIALVLLFAYQVAPSVNPLLGLVVGLALAAIMPWLLLRSLKFRLHNTSYRGLRFGFNGRTGGAYRVFILWPFLTALTLYLLGPMWHQRLKAWQHGHSAFGGTQAAFEGKIRSFYRLYLGAVLLAAAVAVAIGVMLVLLVLKLQSGGLLDFGGNAPQPGQMRKIVLMGLFAVSMMIFLSLFVWPYVTARVQNLVWNNTRLGSHRFQSTVSARRLTWVALTNFLLVAVTLGLYKPFAAVRMARTRLEAVALLPVGSLEEFMVAAEANVAAVGEEFGEFFDFDIAL